MALGATTQWEVRTAGSDSSGGGFTPASASGVTDYAATSGTGTAPVVTSATYNFVAGDVGAYVFILSGTNWIPGWYKIDSVASNAATVNASVGQVILYNGATFYNTTAGIASVASPTGGTGSVDYSQQDAAEVTGTATSAGTTLTATTGIFTPVMVGNLITNGTSWKCITAYTSTLVVTLDSDPSWTAQSVVIGGAVASPSLVVNSATGIAVSGNSVWIKTGTYNRSTTLTVLDVALAILGYSTLRGDTGQATFRATAGSITLISWSGDNDRHYLRNITADADGQTSVTGINIAEGNGQSSAAYNCIAIDCATGFVVASSRIVSKCIGCWADNCTTGFSLGNQGVAYACYSSTASGGTGFVCGGGGGSGVVLNSIAGGGSLGFTGGGSGNSFGAVMISNVAYGTSSHGFSFDGTLGAALVQNNVAYGCGGYGFRDTTSDSLFLARGNNAYGSNSSGNLSNVPPGLGDVILTADPFTNAAAGDFSLNTTAGGGAACRAAGFPGVFPGGLTTGHLDIGAVQHEDTPGGSSLIGGGLVL